MCAHKPLHFTHTSRFHSKKLVWCLLFSPKHWTNTYYYYRYKDSINRLSEEDSNKIFGFSRPAQPTKQSDIPAQYIPRDPGSPSRGASHDVTSVDSVTSSYSVTSIPPPTDAELSSMISPISISPVSEEGCKRESSCSDSGVDVTSLSICWREDNNLNISKSYRYHRGLGRWLIIDV